MAIKNYLINDKWLDIDKQNIVEVKSTDGVIGSVKVNGEEYSGSGGGGESDFSTAKVTVVNEDALEIKVPLAVNVDNEKLSTTGIYESGAYDVILYGGSCYGSIPEMQAVVSVSGDIVLEENNYIIITGDGTITITAGVA